MMYEVIYTFLGAFEGNGLFNMVAIGGASISIDVLNPNLQLRRQV
jgi:hypothetical protein